MSARLLPRILVLVLLAALPGPAWPRTPEQARAQAVPPDLRTLQDEVERVRRLQFLRPVASETRTREEAGQYVQDLLHRETEGSGTALRETFLRALGLLPEETSLESLLGRVLGEQVRGLYDPQRKVFLVVGDAPEEDPAGALLPSLGLDLKSLYTLHELEHALQDQHFDLQEREKRTGGRLDATLALQALMEGDANLVMFDAAGQRLGVDSETMVELTASGVGGALPAMDAYPEFQGAPRFMREYLTMPYFGGLRFVATLRQDGGWERVDQAFRTLPASTEQILHPERYLGGQDPPLQVDLSGLPAGFGDYRLVGEDTAGEFVLRVWGEEHLGTPAGREAAAGWGGDTWREYRSGDSRFMLWVTAWDSEADARDFEALARKARTAPGDQVLREGAEVLVLMDAPAELAQAVLRAAGRRKVHR